MGGFGVWVGGCSFCLPLYRPGVAQRVGRGIALLFHDRGTRRGCVVSSTLRPHFTPGKDPVPILQEAGWAARPVWTGGKSRPHRDSFSDRPARSSVAISTELSGPPFCLPSLVNLFIWQRYSDPRGGIIISSQESNSGFLCLYKSSLVNIP